MRSGTHIRLRWLSEVETGESHSLAGRMSLQVEWLAINAPVSWHRFIRHGETTMKGDGNTIAAPSGQRGV